MRRAVFAAASNTHHSCVSREETTGINIALNYRQFIVGGEGVRTRKGVVVFEDGGRAHEDLIKLLGRRHVIVVKFPAELNPAISIGIAEGGSASDDGFFVHLNEKVDSDSSTKAMLGRGFSKVGKENVFEEAAGHFLSVKNRRGCGKSRCAREQSSGKENWEREGERLRWRIRKEGERVEYL